MLELEDSGGLRGDGGAARRLALGPRLGRRGAPRPQRAGKTTTLRPRPGSSSRCAAASCSTARTSRDASPTSWPGAASVTCPRGTASSPRSPWRGNRVGLAGRRRGAWPRRARISFAGGPARAAGRQLRWSAADAGAGAGLGNRAAVVVVDDAWLGLWPLLVDQVFEALRQIVAGGSALLLVSMRDPCAGAGGHGLLMNRGQSSKAGCRPPGGRGVRAVSRHRGRPVNGSDRGGPVRQPGSVHVEHFGGHRKADPPRGRRRRWTCA